LRPGGAREALRLEGAREALHRRGRSVMLPLSAF
jgi:hypothetical protein